MDFKFDLIFKSKNEEFNLSNVNLFERQVETDKSRLERGEISLTDLAQSEASLAGAKAQLIEAENKLITSKFKEKIVLFFLQRKLIFFKASIVEFHCQPLFEISLPA